MANLWTVEQSRLERREAEWFRLAAELDAAGISEVHTKRDGIVRVRDEVAGIKAVINAGEVRKMKARINDRLTANAANGLPAGSRPYGNAHGVTERGEKTYVIVPAEADVIRKAAEQVLAGWSLSSIAADLRERGLHGPHRVKVRDRASGEVVTEDGCPVEDGGTPKTRPSTITQQSVKSWVTNPTVAGFRVHQGVQVGKGNWTSILDESTWRAVRNKLAAPRVVQRSDGGTYPITPTVRTTGRRYLLTGGTAVCGECKAPLVAQMKQLTRKFKDGTRVLWRVAPYYLCHPKTGGKACVGIMGDQLEEHVVAELFAELDKPAFRRMLAADEHAARRNEITAGLEAVEQQRVDLAKLWGARKLTPPEWMAAREVLNDEEGRLRRELATVPPPLSRIDPTKIRVGWGAMTLDERRDIISMSINRVVVLRAKPGTAGFDTGRVDIDWRG